MIVGICQASPTFQTFPIVYTTYSQATRYVPSERKVLSFVLAQAEDGVPTEEVCARIQQQTGLAALTSEQFIQKTIVYYLQRTGIAINFGITVTLGFVVGTAVAGLVFFLFTLENLKQFGALKAPLPGVILEVYVPVQKVGQVVKQGDPLFLVDNRALKAQLKYQEANLAAAEANLTKLEKQPRPEEVPPTEGAVKVAEANVAMQQDLADRNHTLYQTNAVAAQDHIQSQLVLKQARATLAQAQANLALQKAGAWEPDKAITRASIALAKAQIEQTKTDLDRALVRAPVDGKVLQVNVRPGEYVGTPPSQALIVLGSIANLHVRVDIDEHDIPRFRESLPAEASVRGDPSQKFPLRFVRVQPYVIPKKSLTGDNTERVDTRVLQVIYAITNGTTPLYVGQQVDVSINTESIATATKGK